MQIRCVMTVALIAAVAYPHSALGEKNLILKVRALPQQMVGPTGDLAEIEVREAFYERFPHIEISTLGRNDEPDILMMGAGGTKEFADKGKLLPLDGFVSRIPPDALAERVPEVLRPSAFFEGMDGKKRWWALPTMPYVYVLGYRKDLFRKCGLDPNRPPRDWPELLAAARKLTDPEAGTYGMGSIPNWSLHVDWYPFLAAAGGDTFVRDEEGNWKPAFGSPAAVEAAELFVELYARSWRDASGTARNGFVPDAPKSWRSWTLWKEGKVGMRLLELTDLGAYGAHDPDVVGIVPIPRFPGREQVHYVSGSLWGISSTVRGRNGYSTEEVIEAAWQYILFFRSDEAQRIRTRVCVERDDAWQVQPKYLVKYGYEEEIEKLSDDDAWSALYDRAMASGKAMPNAPGAVYAMFALIDCINLEKRGELGKTPEERKARIMWFLRCGADAAQEKIDAQARTRLLKRLAVPIVLAVAILLSAVVFCLFRRRKKRKKD